MSFDKLMFWKNLRDSAISNGFSDESNHTHHYSFWKKEEKDNGDLVYQRNCLECGYIERFISKESNKDIEKEIKKQLEGEKLVDYFVNSSEKELSNENILFYLVNTSRYHSYMNMNEIFSKLKDINKLYEIHNNYDETLIYNTLLSLNNLGEIPEELFIDIMNYLNGNSEYLGKDTIKGKSL